ncbi:MAG TPA: heme NO-binding domain-containing protein [Ktedonobacteraceae bacterium]|nr:heme NO-binding domain-containing protein [Ktedonobacteraceae bacterium]
MHGLIFVTWEKYLAERFGSSFLNGYRDAINETPATAPLASRVYDDAVLLAGVGAAAELSHLPANTLLREYGRYFIINGLTSHLCAYLLAQVQSGRDLLLMMRKAHAQMRRIPDALTPPIFGYEALENDPKGLTLIYDSDRHLCPVLHGAIEGAAVRYGEKVQIVETACMTQGAPACRFEIRFFSLTSGPLSRIETPEQVLQRNSRRQLADKTLSVLPYKDGLTLQDLQHIMQQWHHVNSQQLRPSVLLESLRHLQLAGLVASTANQPGDDLAKRRYWRVPTSGN